MQYMKEKNSNDFDVSELCVLAAGGKRANGGSLVLSAIFIPQKCDLKHSKLLADYKK